MKINVIQARVVTEEGSVKLTKSVAKQFPLKWGYEGRELTRKQTPICKVLGATLGPNAQKIRWLFLVADEMAGYVWADWCGSTELALKTPTVIL